MTSLRYRSISLVLSVPLMMDACGRRVPTSGPAVDLVCEVLPGGVEARISAAVRGDVSSLRYEWIPGNMIRPPVSEDAKAVFVPASPGVKVVGVKVYYTRDLYVQASTTCDFGSGTAGRRNGGPLIKEVLRSDRGVPGKAGIEITRKPEIDPVGGPDTRAEIAGRVTGVTSDSGMFVAVYSKTDRWYLQPLVGSRIPFDASGNWSTWTHTGSRYAALLVVEGFNPPPVLESLPSGPLVAARTELPNSH